MNSEQNISTFPLPRKTHPGERPSSKWCNEVADNIAFLRGAQRIGAPRKDFFNISGWMPFQVVMKSENTVAVTDGKVYVHANPSSPFVYTEASPHACDPAEEYNLVVVAFDWTTGVIIMDCFKLSDFLPSDEEVLIYPLARLKRYGDSVANYVWSLDKIYHIGDIHVCGNTGTISAGEGIGFRSTLTGSPGISATLTPPNSLTMTAGRVTAGS